MRRPWRRPTRALCGPSCAPRQWALQLSVGIAEANGCKTYYRDRCGGVACFLIGRASDANTARYMFTLLAGEVRRLNRDCCQTMPEKYRRDFKYGVVAAIREKFRNQWKKTKEAVRAEIVNNPLALVRLDNALAKMENRLAQVEAWSVANAGLNKPRPSNYKTRQDAYNHGFQEGQKVNVNSRAKAGLGN